MRKVVALVRIKRERSHLSGRWKSRIPALYLTAEGASVEEADARLAHLFRVLLDAYRGFGEERLATMLSRTGLEWHWADEYRGPTPALDVSSDARVLSGALVASDGRSAQPLAA